MTEIEKDLLRKRYQEWPTERLVIAATKESRDYDPEAIPIMIAELNQRGLAQDRLVTIAETLPPPLASPERNTRFRPSRLKRKQYALRWVVWLVGVSAIAILLSMIPFLQHEAFVAMLIFAAVYKITCMDIPRLKDAGLSPFLLFVMLVPIANLGLLLLLFLAPSRE